MKIVVTGAGGQLGQELARTVPAGVEITALRRTECDVGDADAVRSMMARERPDAIINAAAFTAVDKAETETGQAQRANALGPFNLASSSPTVRLLQVSTDFVFDGSQSRPWRPGDATNPLSVYGRSKLEGEAHALALGKRGLVIRTSWVYSKFGNNFVKTMLKLMSTRPEVRVVADQIGGPTWTGSVAAALWRAIEKPELSGLYHWCDAGVASWYDLAVAVAEEATAIQLLTQPVKVTPIGTLDYPTPARRPSFSVLECSGSWKSLDLTPPHWRTHLRQVLQELKEENG